MHSWGRLLPCTTGQVLVQTLTAGEYLSTQRAGSGSGCRTGTRTGQRAAAGTGTGATPFTGTGAWTRLAAAPPAGTRMAAGTAGRTAGRAAGRSAGTGARSRPRRQAAAVLQISRKVF